MEQTERFLECTVFLLFLQMLGHQWEHCPLVGDQRTSCGFHHGMTDADWLTLSCVLMFLHLLGDSLTHCNVMTASLSFWVLFFFFLIKFSDQLCPVHWNNHHPGAETAVSWHWRERIQHLPVSYCHPVQLCQCVTYRNAAYREVNHDDCRISSAICSMKKSDWLFLREQSWQYSTFFLLSIKSCVFQNLKWFDLTPPRFLCGIKLLFF